MLPHPRRAWVLLSVGDPVVLDAPIGVSYPIGYVMGWRGEATVTGNLLWKVREDAGITRTSSRRHRGPLELHFPPMSTAGSLPDWTPQSGSSPRLIVA